MEYPAEKTHYALKMEQSDTSVLGNVHWQSSFTGD